MRENWSQRNVGDVLSMEYGAALPATTRSGDRYPVFGSSGEVGRNERFLVDGPGIVVGRKGSVGQVSWTNHSFWPIDTTYFVSSKGADLRWLYWTLLRLPLRRLDSSTGVPGLNRNDAYELALDVPPLPEQRQIAAILDTLDDAIRKTEQIIAKLKQVKQGLLHDLLTRGIDDNGELRDPDRHPEQFKESALGRIPKGWEVAQLGSRLAVHGGKRLPAGHVYAETPTGFRYLRVLDFFRRKFTTEELVMLHRSTFEALERYEIHSGDLFISIAGSLGYVGVFRPSAVPHERTILTENAARLVPTFELVPEFVAEQMNSRLVQGQIEVEKGVGGGVPKLALFRIESLLLAWPAIGEQQRVVECLESSCQRITHEENGLAKLRVLKAGLMEDLLTGRVRVTSLVDCPPAELPT